MRVVDTKDGAAPDNFQWAGPGRIPLQPPAHSQRAPAAKAAYVTESTAAVRCDVCCACRNQT